jgi:hypothetical protein
MRKIACLVVAVNLAVVLFAGVRTAHADRGYHSASSCLSLYTYENSEARIWRGTTGFWYYETTSQSVICPIRIDASGTINPTAAQVRVWEDSSVGDIRCTPHFVDDAIVTDLGTKYSCFSTPGGCTDASLISQGMDGYLTWADALFPTGNRSGELTADFICTLGANDFGEYMQMISYEVTY